MPIVWSSVVTEAAEVAGSMTEAYEDVRTGYMRASVTLRCLYANRHVLVQDTIGNRLAWPKGNLGRAPIATTAAIVPVVSPADSGAANGQAIDYSHADVTLNFTTEVTDLFSESIEPTVEFLTLDHRWFRWGPTYWDGYDATGTGTGSGGAYAPSGLTTQYDGEPLREEEAPGRQVRGINFVRTDMQVPGPLNPAIFWMPGHVNADPCYFSLLGFTALQDQLMYAQPSVTYKYDSTGVVKYDTVKTFIYNPNGFNRYYRSSTSAWHHIYVAGTDVPHLSYPQLPFNGSIL